jgi:hypothetical protein
MFFMRVFFVQLRIAKPGHKAADCWKQGGGVQKDSQQPGAANKKLFQTAASTVEGSNGECRQVGVSNAETGREC